MSEAGTPQEENNYLSLPGDAQLSSAEQTDASAEAAAVTDASNHPHPSLEGTASAEEAPPRTEVVSLIKTWSPPPEDESRSPGTTETTARRSKMESLSSPAEVANFMALAQELRQRNRDLLNRANQLEQALLECKQALHSQITKSQTQEALLTQTTQELNQSQEQASSLFRELEASHQATVRQQILIETLTEQLEGSQERIAQLERECTAVQQRYNEQSHQLIQSENTARELRSRLQRQQRQTLQFKAALEKCLEVPVLKDEIENIKEELSPSSRREGKGSSAERPRSLSPSPKAQPIQPWSAQNESLQQPDPSSWVESSPLSPSPLNFLEWQPIEEEDDDTDLAAGFDESIFHLVDDLDEEPQLVEQSGPEALFQLLNELESILPPPDTEVETPPEQLTLEVSTSIPAETNSAEELLEDAEASAESNVDPHQPFILQSMNLLPVGDEGDVEEEDTALIQQWSSGEEETAESQPAAFRRREQVGTILSQANWSSPVVYPLRPPKGRKSLAAIELPTFPRRGS